MRNDDQYLSALSKNKMYRVMSWICIFVIVGLIVATVVTGIMGSPYFMGCLLLMILVPLLFYVVLWIGRLLFKYGGNTIEEDFTETSEEDVEVKKED